MEIKNMQDAERAMLALKQYFQSQLEGFQVPEKKPVQSAKNYRDWTDLCDVLHDYMETAGEEVGFEDLLQGLLNAGCELGANPAKNLRTRITMNPARFYWKGDKVGLVSWRRKIA